MEVFRGGNIVVVGGGAYGLYGLVTAAHNEAKMYGPDNPAFHMPGWFYSGSPYGRQIKELADRNNIFMSDVPVDFVPEYVPPPGKVWRSTEPKWIDHYGVRDIYEREMK